MSVHLRGFLNIWMDFHDGNMAAMLISQVRVTLVPFNAKFCIWQNVIKNEDSWCLGNDAVSLVV
jgi:hypothetical protein